jgi:hypothetical protein
VPVATGPQRNQEAGDVLLPHLCDPDDVERGEVGRVAPEVAPVGRQGVGRKAALDREMVEVGPNDAKDGSQTRTSKSATAVIPWASATGSYVT